MKSQADDEIDPILLIQKLNNADIRYLLIGAAAAFMHNIPVGSPDWDFWIHPDDRGKTTDILLGFGLNRDFVGDSESPKQTFTDDEGFKADIFFVGSFSNSKKGLTVSFDDVFSRQVVKYNTQGSFYVRVPALEDLKAMLELLDEPREQYLKRIEYFDEALRKNRDSDSSPTATSTPDLP